MRAVSSSFPRSKVFGNHSVCSELESRDGDTRLLEGLQECAGIAGFRGERYGGWGWLEWMEGREREREGGERGKGGRYWELGMEWVRQVRYPTALSLNLSRQHLLALLRYRRRSRSVGSARIRIFLSNPLPGKSGNLFLSSIAHFTTSLLRS